MTIKVKLWLIYFEFPILFTLLTRNGTHSGLCHYCWLLEGLNKENQINLLKQVLPIFE